MVNLIRSFAIVTILTLGMSHDVAAQGFRLRGVVIQVTGNDTIPLTGAWVALHRVRGADGVVRDSTRTDRLGRFVLGEREPDSIALYLAGVMHHDLAYFSDAVRGADVATEHVFDPLVVFDTSSTGDDMVLLERHVVLRQPNAEGVRQVVELNVLYNPTAKTRVPGENGLPVWRTVLPPDVYDFAPGPSDVSPDALSPRGDTLELFAPIPPGRENRREMVYGYSLNSGSETFVIPVVPSVGRLQVLIEDLDAELIEGPVTSLGVEAMADGTQLLRYEGNDVPSETLLVFRLSGTGPKVQPWAIFLIVGMVSILMGGILIRSRFGGATDGVAVQPRGKLSALESMAQLDREFAALGRAPSERRRAIYMRRRQALSDIHAAEVRRSDS